MPLPPCLCSLAIGWCSCSSQEGKGRAKSWRLGGRFVVVMDTVVGLGRHKRFPLTQNPLTGVGFLSRASHGSVVMLAVVFSSLARPEWTFQARGFQSSAIKGKKCNNSKTSCLKSFCLNTSRSLPVFFTASCLVLAWSLHCFPKTPCM